MGEEGTTQTTRTVANIFLVLIIGVLVIFAARMPFVHKKYEYVDSEVSPEYKSLRATYKPILHERDSLLNLLITDLDTDKITKEEFVLAFKEVKGKSKTKLKAFTKRKYELLNKYKYRGWNAYYYFLLHIGTPIMAIVLCLLYFYVLANPMTTQLKKIIFSLYGSLFLFSASYMTLHVLFSQQVYQGDFPKEWYKNIMRYVPILVSFTLPVLFYHYQNIEQKLTGIIHTFFYAIYKDIPNEGFIKPEKEEAYIDFQIKITDKVVGNDDE